VEPGTSLVGEIPSLLLGGKMRRLSDVERQRILELYQLGLSIRKVQDIIGYSFQTVARTVRAAGYSRPAKRTWPEELRIKQQEILIKYLEGSTMPELAKEYNCAIGTIQGIVAVAGVSRPKGRRPDKSK
jgi:hypothetical protein